MDKTTVLAFILIGLIFLLWMSPWYQKNVIGVQPALPDSTQTLAPEIPSEQRLSQALVQKPVPTPEAVKNVQASGTQSVQDTSITLSNNLIQARFSSQGGGTLVSWKLIDKQRDDTDNYRYKGIVSENEPVELIPEEASGNLAITTDRNLDFGRLPSEISHHSISESGIHTIRFSSSAESGGQLIKTFTLNPNSYDLKMNIRFLGFSWDQIGEKFNVEWNSGLRPTEPNIKKNDGMYYESMALQGDELNKQKKKGNMQLDGNTQWVSIRTKYFLMALIPEETGIGANLSVTENGEWKSMQTRLALPWNGLQDENHAIKVYLGPMDYKILKSYDAELERTMSWGWSLFKPLSIGALYALHFLYSKIHNYGWAIIVFGILIKVILFPLTRHSYKSMREMQALQPKMATIKEKYKSDPQKLNEETMKLYKAHGVNPMGGCLPMLLQMPVLFALFNLFRSTIMLRHAEFYLIKDLSAPDHILGSINILPLLMGASMIIQQRLSSASNQNQQQKMMALMMPIVFLFLFYNFSSGLNLYYLVFNVFTIAQEILVKRGKKEEVATSV